MTTDTKDDHVTSDEGVPAPSLLWDIDSDPLDADEISPGAPVFSLFDAGSFGDDPDDSALDFLDDEEGGFGAPGSLQKLRAPEEGDIPKPRRRRRAEAIETFGPEDFHEGAERNAFLTIDGYAHKLFGPKSTAKGTREAIHFFFTVTDDGDGITFPLCCSVLQVREDVLRLRIQYEWWLREAIFTGPLPFLVVPLPGEIAGEIALYGREAGLALARRAWVQPGVNEEELLDDVMAEDAFNREALVKTLEVLEGRFLMSRHADRWHLTGRNPMMQFMARSAAHGRSDEIRRSSTIHWSRLFA